MARIALLFVVLLSSVGCINGTMVGGAYVPPPSTSTPQYREVPVSLPSYTIGSGAGISVGGRTAPGTLYGFNSNFELEYRKLYPARKGK